jgi:hypothetical protein
MVLMEIDVVTPSASLPRKGFWYNILNAFFPYHRTEIKIGWEGVDDALYECW